MGGLIPLASCPLFRACLAQTTGPEDVIRFALGLVVSVGLWAGLAWWVGRVAQRKW